jgi:hypothetical protein
MTEIRGATRAGKRGQLPRESPAAKHDLRYFPGAG